MCFQSESSILTHSLWFITLLFVYRSLNVQNTARSVATAPTDTPSKVNEISEENPLKVLIAGAGVGGLALANVLEKNPAVDVTVLERTDQFKRFGGPIQLASNALQVIKEMDHSVYEQVMDKFTFTGDKENGTALPGLFCC